MKGYHFCILHITLVLLSWDLDDQVCSLLCHVLHQVHCMCSVNAIK